MTRILFSPNSLYISWLTSGLKVSTNERTSWIWCVRWGWQCWGGMGASFQRHVPKCDAYITYCMHAHSFKAAIIAFLVTHALTDGITLTLHAHSFFGCLIWNDTQAAVRAGIFVLKSARYEHSIFPTLVWLAPGAEAMLERASETSPVWCGHKDVLHLHKRNPFQEKRDEGSSCEWGGQP